MRVIVHAEDHSGRGDGYYTKPGIDAALKPFFGHGSDTIYADRDAEEPMTAEDAAIAFRRDRAVMFFMESGEKVTITLDA